MLGRYTLSELNNRFVLALPPAISAMSTGLTVGHVTIQLSYSLHIPYPLSPFLRSVRDSTNFFCLPGAALHLNLRKRRDIMQPDNISTPQPTPPLLLTPDAPPRVTPLPQPVSRFGPIPIYARTGSQTAQQSRTIRSRFREMPRIAQVLIAVGAALSLMVCSCCSCSGLVGALGNMSPTVQATATPGRTNAGSVTYKPGATATTTQMPPSPTAQPTATATATPMPQPPTATPKPRPSCLPGAVNCNPWGYNFTSGHYISSVPSGFCTYFACINNFYNGRGYVMECHDGMYSKSGGISGSCSHHGGNWRPLLAP
jgi:hypothetical protein